MPTPTIRWEVPPPAPPAIHARLSHLHPIIVQVLYNRGLADVEDVAEFFGQRRRPDDPFRIKGVSQAVTRLRQAIRRQEPIAVYGDFDADGVTATALMVQTLAAFGADVMPYIPHRVDEGYGLNNEALKWLHDQGVRVVLTVDCGIRAVAEATYAANLGLEMIISDHHSIGPTLPPALAVINPRQADCSYHFDAFAGVGVAFKLAQALLRAEAAAPIAAAPVQLVEEDLLDLAAVGTVADIMPLRGENRLLVQRGLIELQRGRRPGLRALAKQARTPLEKIDAAAIGFRLGPRLNAAGRLHSAVLAYDLLMAADDQTAEPLAHQLDALNQERQRLTQEAVKWAETELGDNPAENVLLVARAGLNPGIVGLIASRLKEQYYRPALVVDLGEEEARGSARSIPAFHITEALDQCADLLTRYGGHAAAAGFTLHRRHLPALRQRLNAIAAERLDPDTRVQHLPVDAVVHFKDLDFALLARLRELEPTGAENPPPTFAAADLLVQGFRRVGGDASHLKIKLSDGQITYEGIGFGLGERALDLPMRVDVAFELNENVWNTHRSLELMIKDIQPAGRGIPHESV